jgi:ketosteroid isomerase-like protein
MKQLLISFMTLFILASCNNSAQVASSTDSTGSATTEAGPDSNTAKKDISALMDAVHNGLHQKDFNSIESAMSPDALVLGTDPKEVWGFGQFRDSMHKFFADTSYHGMQYQVPTHQITVHGSSAIIIDQYQLNDISKKLMTRNIAHARYENGKWLLDLMSWNLIPTNEDVPKIDKAL